MADQDIERIVDTYAAQVPGGPVRLAIVGSVAFTHPGDWMSAQLVIRDEIERLRPVRVISGGAPGIDTLAENVGAEYGYSEDDRTLLVFRPAVKRWDGEGGFKARNTRIAEACTHLLRVFCQSSRTYGSGWTADLAQHLGKDVRRYSPCLAVQGTPRDVQPDLFGEVRHVG